MTDLLRKLKAWSRREALDAELQEEIRSHLNMKAADLGNVEAARRAFGNQALILEDARSAWGWPSLESLWQDLRYGVRMLRKSPPFTAVAVLSLAIGIGGNTAIFSLVDRVLLRSLPVEDAERLVILGANSSSGVRTAFTYPDFADYRARNEVFDGLVCYTPRPLTLINSGHAERIQGMLVSGNYFTALRVQPALGRTFLPEEDRTRGTHPVIVLGYGSWQRRFGGDPAVVGKQITLNGYGFTVVGIAPPKFTGTIAGIAPDVYVPIMMQGQVSPGWKLDPLFGPRSRGLAWLEVMGRLKPGISREQAAAAMTILGSQIAKANPNQDGTPRPEPKFILSDGRMGQTRLFQDLRFPLQLLMATVGLILLIACSNVANLLLARAGTRQREIAVRLASGAGRGRLIRQLLTESLLLSGLGGAAGLVLAATLSGVLAGFAPPDTLAQVTLDSRLDQRVLGFAVLLSLLTAILFGLAPALIGSRMDLVTALKDETVLFGSRGRRVNLRNLLVVAQVALSLVVLVGAGLCIRSLRNLQSIDTGFDTSSVLIMSVDVGLSGYTNDRGMRFYSDLTHRIKTLSGVDAVSVAALVPLGGGFGMNFVAKIEGYTPKPGDNPTLDYNIVGPDYFRTLKVPVMQGREFSVLDAAAAPKVAIINETAARSFWPGQNPVGRRLADSRAFFDTEPKEIVGVVKDSKYRDLKEGARPAIYVPLPQDYRSGMALHVRTVGEPVAMLANVKREVQALDASLPVYDIRTLDEQKNGSLYSSRMAASLLTIFGLLALLLAAVGLFGVIAFAIDRRRREIGIRMALGAQGADVRRLMMLEGMAVVVAGLVLGLAGALALTRLVRSILFGVTPTDPVTFVVATALLAAVGMLASYLPACRASRIDPIITIKC